MDGWLDGWMDGWMDKYLINNPGWADFNQTFSWEYTLDFNSCAIPKTIEN